MSTIDDKILEGILPSVALALVRQGKIKEKHLGEPGKLFSRFLRYRRQGLAKTQLYTAIESSFLKEALKLWKEDEREIGIVLFATAIEQLLNGNYRFILEARGLNDDEITKVIRSNSLDAKITWLFILITQRRFPINIAKRLRFIAEARNSIVHYKAQPDHIDNGGGSHSHIRSLIEQCKGWRMAEFYYNLERFLLDVVYDVGPEYEIAIKAARVILDERVKALKRSAR